MVDWKVTLMELAAICLVLVTCGMLIGMVVVMAVSDRRRERTRRAVDLVGRLAPYDRTVVDLRDQRPEWRPVDGRSRV